MAKKIIIVKGNREKKIDPDQLKDYESSGWKQWKKKAEAPKQDPDQDPKD